MLRHTVRKATTRTPAARDALHGTSIVRSPPVQLVNIRQSSSLLPSSHATTTTSSSVLLRQVDSSHAAAKGSISKPHSFLLQSPFSSSVRQVSHITSLSARDAAPGTSLISSTCCSTRSRYTLGSRHNSINRSNSSISTSIATFSSISQSSVALHTTSPASAAAAASASSSSSSGLEAWASTHPYPVPTSASLPSGRLPARFRAKRELDAFRFSENGEYVQTTFNLSSLKEVHARDLIAIDDSEIRRSGPVILPRKECIIISISHIKAIIFADHLLLLDAHRPLVRIFAESLRHHLKIGFSGAASSPVAAAAVAEAAAAAAAAVAASNPALSNNSSTTAGTHGATLSLAPSSSSSSSSSSPSSGLDSIMSSRDSMNTGYGNEDVAGGKGEQQSLLSSFSSDADADASLSASSSSPSSAPSPLVEGRGHDTASPSTPLSSSLPGSFDPTLNSSASRMSISPLTAFTSIINSTTSFFAGSSSAPPPLSSTYPDPSSSSLVAASSSPAYYYGTGSPSGVYDVPPSSAHEFVLGGPGAAHGGAGSFAYAADIFSTWADSTLGTSAFEFRALEGILRSVSDKYDRRLRCYSPVITALLQELTSDSTSQSSAIPRLLPLKNSLHSFERASDELLTVLTGLIHSNEDMLELFLTEKKRRHGQLPPMEAHQECELLLEQFHREISQIKLEAQHLRKKILATEDLVRITMDSYRNRMIMVQAYMSLVSGGLAAGALITGMFGMNLHTGIELHPYAFYVVASSSMAVAAAIYFFVYRNHLYKPMLGLFTVSRRSGTVEDMALLRASVEDLGDVQDIILQLTSGRGPIGRGEFRRILRDASGRPCPEHTIDLIYKLYGSKSKSDGDFITQSALQQFMCDFPSSRWTGRSQIEGFASSRSR